MIQKTVHLKNISLFHDSIFDNTFFQKVHLTFSSSFNIPCIFFIVSV